MDGSLQSHDTHLHTRAPDTAERAEGQVPVNKTEEGDEREHNERQATWKTAWRKQKRASLSQTEYTNGISKRSLLALPSPASSKPPAISVVIQAGPGGLSTSTKNTQEIRRLRWLSPTRAMEPRQEKTATRQEELQSMYQAGLARRPAVQVPADLEQDYHLYMREQSRNEAVFGWEHGHKHFDSPDDVPLVVVSVLGNGSLGIVEEVTHKSLQFPTLARKKIQLPFSKLKQSQRRNIIQEEAKILQQLVHVHIVTLIGSYEETVSASRQFYSLLMTPVGDHDLATFLDVAGVATSEKEMYQGWIQKWFGCLSTALMYMHGQGIRHQDIKPSNIIQRGGDIYFTDFSSSCRFTIGRTTSTENPARSSLMYGAPEVVNKFSRDGRLKRHGRLSDIFSLGAVFCDMLAVYEGHTIPDLHEFLEQDGQGVEKSDTDSASSIGESVLMYSRKTHEAMAWFESSNFFESIISPMLSLKREDRPEASKVVTTIMSLGSWKPVCRCAPQHITTS
ncbi:kinase-like protein [Polyplosphaeria fusca]|uniref:Kinase-like protein n=1 Tax=Polyplosphaeria fusca TaxID=682080 RepID=A0A9P4R8X4_9PLEO|nr:kinase-like protein [Polyplosphaeria fusca]